MASLEEFEKRFWSKVNKNGPIHPYDISMGQCWIWTASKNKKGYGMINTNWIFHTNYAHRVVKILVGDPIPDELMGLHSCDRPSCVNPSHIKSGTNQENVAQSVLRGRRAKQDGERNHNSKLSKSEISSIRKKYLSGNFTQNELAMEYGVSQVHISRIVNLKSWEV